LAIILFGREQVWGWCRWCCWVRDALTAWFSRRWAVFLTIHDAELYRVQNITNTVNSRCSYNAEDRDAARMIGG